MAKKKNKKGTKKKQQNANGQQWREQAVIVKKTHPFARSKGEAETVAERHAQTPSRGTESTNGTYRVALRPKTCFRKFRGQRRGPHVTVYWGELKVKMRGKPECK